MSNTDLKKDAVLFLEQFAAVLCSDYGLRPGVDPLCSAYRTGRFDGIHDAIAYLEDFEGTLDEAALELKGREQNQR